MIVAAAVHWGGFEWWGNFTTVDLIAATTNALNGALLARRPDHYKQFTVVGILLMALLGGLGYALRMTALYRAWEEPLAREPAGVYQHEEGRPMLGRKLKGKSQLELRDLGLTIEEERNDVARSEL